MAPDFPLYYDPYWSYIVSNSNMDPSFLRANMNTNLNSGGPTMTGAFDFSIPPPPSLTSQVRGFDFSVPPPPSTSGVVRTPGGYWNENRPYVRGGGVDFDRSRGRRGGRRY